MNKYPNHYIDDFLYQDELISGFYYDEQLKDRAITVTLHPNQMLSSSGPNATWVDAKNCKDLDTYSEDSEVAFPYSNAPICTSILADDFQVSIANTWSDFGGDPIGDLWNTIRPMAPYVSKAMNSLKKISEKSKAWVKNNETGKDKDSQGYRDFVSGFAKIGGEIAKKGSYAGKALNRALITQGTRFSYYGGTGIDFGGNLCMKFTLLSEYKDFFVKWTPGSDPTVVSGFISVYDQLSNILPYAIGNFQKVTDLKEFGINSEAASDFAQQFLCWQYPPGGFEAECFDIDVVQKGTLKLKIGSFFGLENLVVQNVQFQFSKSFVKVASGEKFSDIVPAYCEVVLTLRPASKYSQNTLMRVLNGDAMTQARENLIERYKKYV